MNQEPIVVIGGGPAGMSAAWQLSKRNQPVVLLERDTMVGGLAKTISIQDEIRCDYGPHTFHIRETDASRQVISEITSLLNDDYSILDRGTRIFLEGHHFTYPPELSQVLRKVSLKLSTQIILDYIYATIKYGSKPPRKEDSFKDWGIRNLGQTLYDTFFGLYSEKVWGVSMAQISSRQAQRVAKLNLINILLRMFKIKADPSTYFVQYLYPHGGIGNLYQRMSDEVLSNNNIVHLKANATELYFDDGKIKHVTYVQNGETHQIACSHLISTLPLSEVTKMMGETCPQNLVNLTYNISYRSLILIFLVIDKPQVTDYHWCYLIEREFLCNRFSEQKNVEPSMFPDDKTVLCVEMSCEYLDSHWQMADADLAQIAINDITKMGVIDEADVSGHSITRIKHAYPIYSLGFETVLYNLLKNLNQIENFYTIGRHGLFMNNSMDENVEMGISAAKQIAEQNTKTNWWPQVLNWTQLQEYDE